MRKGFTLIELLVVVGILGILAVAALVAINPAEAQRKSRDATRLKDMTTLQSAFEQYINDTVGDLPATWVAGAVTSDAGSGGVDCNSNWTGEPLCNYLRQVPRDPVNRVTKIVDSGTATELADGTAVYTLVKGVSSYKICTRLESLSNAGKLNDSGSGPLEPGVAAAVAFAAGSDLTLDCGL